MKQRKPLITGSLIVVLLATFGIRLALAASTMWYSNFAGVTTATAFKDVWVVNSTSWNAHIRSYTTNPTYNISRIGWNWWSFRNTCNGVIQSNWVQPGRVSYGANYISDTGVDSIRPCAGVPTGEVYGKHDFAQGGTVWQPEFSASEPIWPIY